MVGLLGRLGKNRSLKKKVGVLLEKCLKPTLLLDVTEKKHLGEFDWRKFALKHIGWLGNEKIPLGNGRVKIKIEISCCKGRKIVVSYRYVNILWREYREKNWCFDFGVEFVDGCRYCAIGGSKVGKVKGCGYE